MRCVPHVILFAGIVFCGIGVLAGSAPETGKPKDSEIGRFAGVAIEQKKGTASALDIHIVEGKAIRFFSPRFNKDDVDYKEPRTYFNDSGMLHTRGWIVISGKYSGKGLDFNIQPPTLDPFMLGVWSDVLGPAIQVRAANAGADSYLFQGLDRDKKYTFSIEQNGALQWGAGSRKEMDVSLYRPTAKTLKTDGSLLVGGKVGIGTSKPAATLHVGGSQSVQRTAVQTDYAVAETDYYIGVTDTAQERTIALPTAVDKPGRVYIIKDESGGAGTHPITVKTKAGETVDGAASLTIRVNYGVLRVISSGKNWFGM